MAFLTEIIPPRAFETIRNRIADILIDEFSHQATLDYAPDVDPDFFVGRFIPFDKTELPAVNINFASGDYNSKSVISSEGNYTYNIDVYTAAVSTAEDEGDSKATVLLEKILGMILAILQNPVYDSLGYARPSITRLQIPSINIADPSKLQTQDAINFIWGRIQVNVVANETVELATNKLMTGYDTKVKIGTSEVGYSYIGNE